MIDAGAEKSCGLGTGVAVVPVMVLPGRHNWNRTLDPAAAVVVMMSTRTPTTQPRIVVAPTTECSGVAGGVDRDAAGAGSVDVTDCHYSSPFWGAAPRL